MPRHLPVQQSRYGKRFRPLVALLLASSLGAGALPASAEEAPPPFKIGSRLSRGVQRYTGINWLSGTVAGLVATLVLRHELGGKAKARVKTYSLTDLLAGKLKAIDVQLDGSSYRGTPLGVLHVTTGSPVWVRYRKQDGHKPGVASPLLLRLEGTMSETDLAAALRSSKVASKLRMVEFDLPGLGQQQLQLLEPQVDFNEGAVTVKTLLVTAGANPDTGVDLTVTGRPVLQGNSRITLENMKVSSPDIPNPKQFGDFTAKLLNPLVDFQRMDRVDHAFRMERLDIAGDAVRFSGNLLLAPRQPVQLAQQVVKKK